MKIDVNAEIRAQISISDTGYTRNMTLPEIQKWANDRLKSYTVMVREGSLEAKPVSAQIEITDIIFKVG